MERPDGYDSPELEAQHEIAEVPARVLILDAGSQYQKLIDRRVRELGVRCDIAPLDAPTELLEQYDSFIISGGPASVDGDDAPDYNPDIFELNKPVLGICYGQQLVAQHFGGEVGAHGAGREDGKTSISVDTESALFSGFNGKQQVLMSHGDSVLKVPDGFEATAYSGDGDIVAAMESEELGIVTTQFHPEVTETANGNDMLSNFLFNVSGLEAEYTPESKLDTALEYIQETVGERDTLCYVSGGLDSSVSAELMRRANLPGRLRFALVDSGLLREDEVEEVVQTYEEMGLEIDVFNGQEVFANKTTILRDGTQSKTLAEETDPQKIRQIAGDAFADIRPMYLESIGWNPDETVLMMGTLRTDLIESGSAIASVNTDEGGIKIHHNDTDEIRALREANLVVEPLQELHKDEVRELGYALGMPESILLRQPSPGPSAAVRIVPQQAPFRIQPTELEPEPPTIEEINEQMDQFRGESDIGLMVVGMSTVGVQGDRRTARHLVTATSESGSPDMQLIKELADTIPNVVHGVSRIAVLSGSKLDGIVEAPQGGLINDSLTSTMIDKENIALWKQVDAVGRRVIKKYGLDNTLVISQIPIILTALNFGVDGDHMVGVRPFMTEDYMTGVAAVPGSSDLPMEAYLELVAELSKIDSIGRIAFDLSDKPPGTTEWK